MSDADRLTRAESMLSHMIEVNNANTANISKLFDIVNKQNIEMSNLKMATKQAKEFNSTLVKAGVLLGAPLVLGILALIGNTVLTSYNQQQADRYQRYSADPQYAPSNPPAQRNP